jgi:tellurite resistance protein
MRSLLLLAEKKVARRTGEHRIPTPEAIAQEIQRRAAAAQSMPAPAQETPAVPESLRPPPPSADGLSLAEVQWRILERTRGVAEAANSVVDLMCLIAQADGSISEPERDALGAVLKALMGSHLHEAVVKHLIRSSLREIAKDGAEKRLRAIAQMLNAHQLAEDGLILAMSIAFAGDGMTAPERAMLKFFATQISVVPARFDALIDRVRGELKGSA